MRPESELILSWLHKAADDLRVAEMSLAADPSVNWAAAFHAQQAAEKVLKALLTYHAVEFPRTHSLDYLLKLCSEILPDLEAFGEEVASLTDYAVEARYVVTHPEPSRDEAAAAIETAQRLEQLVTALLPQSLD